MLSLRNLIPKRRAPRWGGTLVFFAMTLVVVLAFVAFAVDVGYICLVRAELQLAADAGALAGANSLYSVPNSLESPTYSISPTSSSARATAQQAVSLNSAGPRKASSDSNKLIANLNLANDPAGDIVLGRLIDPGNLAEQLTPNVANPNAVQVSVKMNASHPNGTLPLFFGSALGTDFADLVMTAVAGGKYPTLLPIITDEAHWNTLASGGAGDNYSFSSDIVTSGSDGNAEIVIFPGDWDGTGMPAGNFGLINIGPDTGANIIRSQVDLGPSVSDMAYHCGSISAGDLISGQTGIEATIETAFLGGTADGRTYDGIIGETRYLPLYSSVTGQGTNASFVISKFVVVRVMAVNLGSNPKSVVVQPVSSAADAVGVKISR